MKKALATAKTYVFLPREKSIFPIPMKANGNKEIQISLIIRQFPEIKFIAVESPEFVCAYNVLSNEMRKVSTEFPEFSDIKTHGIRIDKHEYTFVSDQ